jgi:hypothetical protein
MRHYFSTGAIPRLAGGVVEATGPAPLIAPARVVERGAPSALRTRGRAVPLTAVTPPTQVEERATVGSGAEDQSQRIHALPRSGHGGWTTTDWYAKKGAANPALPRCVILPEGPG